MLVNPDNLPLIKYEFSYRQQLWVRNQYEPAQPWRSSQPFAQHHVINRSEYKTETAQKRLAVLRARVVARRALVDCARAFLQ